MKHKHHILNLITLLLMALWIPVTLDKLWDLQGFHQTLLRQPFPNSWAGILYWALPVMEGICVVLLVGGTLISSPMTKRKGIRTWGFALSTFLMVAFTLFILFGVLGWYEKRPCGCGSVISGLSWEQHLWFNLFFLVISVTGWWLAAGREKDPKGPNKSDSGAMQIVRGMDSNTDPPVYTLNNIFAARSACTRFRYPRRFAPFPGRPAS